MKKVDLSLSVSLGLSLLCFFFSIALSRFGSRWARCINNEEGVLIDQNGEGVSIDQNGKGNLNIFTSFKLIKI